MNTDDYCRVQAMRDLIEIFEFRPAVKYPVVDFDLVSNATILQNDAITRTMIISNVIATIARNGQISMPTLSNPKAGDSCIIRVRRDNKVIDR